MKRIFLQGGNDGCFWYRLLLPARHLHRVMAREDDIALKFAMTPLDNQSIDILNERYDAYVLHGHGAAMFLDLIGHWKYRHENFVWNIDDYYHGIPEWNPVKLLHRRLGGVAVARAMADYVHAATPFLAKKYAQYNGKTRVLPNLIDLDTYPPPPPREPGDPLHVVWLGSRTHEGDVALLVEPLSALLSARRGRVKVTFCGMAPDELIRDFQHAGVEFRDGLVMEEYVAMLRTLRPDLALAPLRDCPFNSAKSNLRLIESFALGIPVVASPVGEYKALADSGAPGVILADSPNEWVNAIEPFISDPAAARQLGAECRRYLESEWSWQGAKSKKNLWREAFRECVE